VSFSISILRESGLGDGSGRDMSADCNGYRYWWLLLGVAVLAMTGGGGEK